MNEYEVLSFKIVIFSMIFSSSIENNEPTVAVIPLFGCVDPANTKHYVRGVNVVVRLRKLCPAKWPRLRATAEKCIWIIQNVEAFKDENFYLTGTNQFSKKNENQIQVESFFCKK